MENCSRAGLNGFTGTVGTNALLRFVVQNPDPDHVQLVAGNDLTFQGKEPGTVDESVVRDFADWFAEHGNDGLPALDEGIMVGRKKDKMVVIKAIEAQARAMLRIAYDTYKKEEGGIFQHQDTHECTVQLFANPKAAEIPWSEAGVTEVFDATTQLKTVDDLARHFGHGVRHVIKTAPMPGADLVWVEGVSNRYFDRTKHKFIGQGACTLQALGALLAPAFAAGVKPRAMTVSTIHGITGDQNTVHRFLPGRLARGAPGNLDIIDAGSGSEGDLAMLVRQLVEMYDTFGIDAERSLAQLAENTEVHARRVPARNSATLDIEIVSDVLVNRNDLLRTYRQYAEAHPSLLRIEPGMVITSSRIRNKPESGIMYEKKLTVRDEGKLVHIGGAYAHEQNSADALPRIAHAIARAYAA